MQREERVVLLLLPGEAGGSGPLADERSPWKSGWRNHTEQNTHL